MPYNIIIGRNEKEQKELGMQGLIYFGKSYVKMGQTSSLSNYILLDVAKPHTILISGKKGSGKSYSIAVMAESMANLQEEIKKNLAILIFDTMGIFWSMKFPNNRQSDLLREWGLEARGLDVKVYIPKGKFDEYKERGIPVDYSFAIKPSELNALDWCNIFNIELTSNIGVLIERILSKLIGEYSIEDVIAEVRLDNQTDQETKNACENRFQAAKAWGLFDIEGSEIKDIIRSGEVSILDTSVYDDFNVKALVTSILSKKLLQERISIRKYEELEELETSKHYFDIEEFKKQELPLVWLFIDEGHEFLPKEGKTAASDALIQLIREGRQPGISLVIATQQPGEIHRDVITQSDIVISHRVTAKPDIEALNTINQTYLTTSILAHLNDLPKDKGAAIILDDNNERIYPMRVRPKMSWHSGESLSAIKIKKKLLEI